MIVDKSLRGVRWSTATNEIKKQVLGFGVKKKLLKLNLRFNAPIRIWSDIHFFNRKQSSHANHGYKIYRNMKQHKQKETFSYTHTNACIYVYI